MVRFQSYPTPVINRPLSQSDAITVEFPLVLTSTTGGVLYSDWIHPQNVPRSFYTASLSSLTSAFRSYQVRSVELIFNRRCATTQAGTVWLLATRDPLTQLIDGISAGLTTSEQAINSLLMAGGAAFALSGEPQRYVMQERCDPNEWHSCALPYFGASIREAYAGQIVLYTDTASAYQMLSITARISFHFKGRTSNALMAVPTIPRTWLWTVANGNPGALMLTARLSNTAGTTQIASPGYVWYPSSDHNIGSVTVLANNPVYLVTADDAGTYYAYAQLQDAVTQQNPLTLTGAITASSIEESPKLQPFDPLGR